MKRILGFSIIIFDIIALIIVYLVIAKKGVYKGDIIGLLIDSWEVIGLFIAIMLLGIVLVKTG